MATTLTFKQNEQGCYEASYTSTGDRVAVEVNRTTSGTLIVYGNITGMNKTMLHNFGPGTFKDQFFEIDVPADVEITIVSFTEVTDAKIVGV